jgi:flagellar protein FlbD
VLWAQGVGSVIKVKRLNHQEFVVNAELIQTIESTPDTVITLTDGQKLMVIDSVDEVITKVVEYKRAIFLGPTSSVTGG